MHHEYLTLGAVGKRLGAKIWQIRRLYERGLLPPAERVGPYRVVAESDLPRIEKALKAARYLPSEEVAHVG